MIVLYFLTAFIATTIGAITGMGGGVIIKPALDFLQDFGSQTINILSSASVFSMSVVSIIKQIRMKAKIDYSIAIPLGVGSVFGGFLGQNLLAIVSNSFSIETNIVALQNMILSLLIMVSIYFVRNKSRIKTKELTGVAPSVGTGLLLGLVSSFVGIGGGPINVAFIMFLFSFDIKTSVVYSIITIFFSQLAKLFTVAVGTGFAEYDLSVLPWMITGAVLGGLIGSILNRRLSEKKVEYLFNLVQIAVIMLSLLNILRCFL